MNAKQAGGGGKRSVRDITIEQSESDKRLAAMQRAQEEIGWINDTLSGAGGAGMPLRFHGREAKEVVEALRKRREELRKVLGRGGRAEADSLFRYAQPTRPVAMAQRPLIMAGRELGRDVSVNIEWLLGIIAQQQAVNCNTLYIGQVRASDFRVYSWMNLDVNGSTGEYAFWPLSRPNQPFQDPYNWSGEEGGFFVARIDVPSSWFIDPMDGIAGAGVLQFTIPAPQCDAMLYWGTRGIAEAVTDWYVDGDMARLSTEWVLHESPAGGGFPGSLTSSFEFVSEGLYKSTRWPGSTRTREVTSFERSFAVAAGVSPKIYLGLSVQALATDGEASTFKFGLGDNFEFEYGVTYIMVSQQP
jgi:hypothetical protein